jgi:drug/metabolite transporter (DMT)-like permease
MVSETETGSSTTLRYARIGFFCAMYIVLSGGLIDFNKYLAHEGRFPHPMALTAIHMFTSFVLTSIILTVKPSMMPSVEKCKGRLLDLYKYLVPIGFFFAVMLYGSNKAYMYCSVAFLQFMKETNVVLVFLFSALAGLQTVNRQRVFVILWVISGSSLCVSGELNFVLTGFVLQLVSQFAECCRAVIAELVLTGSDYKLDSLSYAFFISPVCLVVLVIGNIVTWRNEILADTAAMWYLLLPNACLAVCLNITIAQVIKETSAVGFMITGMVKDVVLVCFSSAVFHDTIQTQQWLAFMVTLSGVFFWSYMKIDPGSKVVQTFEKMLGIGAWPFPGEPLMAPAGAKKLDEATPIAPKSA